MALLSRPQSPFTTDDDGGGGAARPDQPVAQAPPSTPNAAQREANALRNAKVDFSAMLPASKPDPSLGVSGGWGGDGFSSLDFGTGDTAAPSPQVVGQWQNNLPTGAGPAPVKPRLVAPNSATLPRAGAAAPATTAAPMVVTPATAGTIATTATPTAVTPPGIDSGVNIGARHLNYGAMVNGVPTFSDGTGGIARTMSPETIAALAKEPSLTRADAGALAHPLASDALGYTPSTDDMVQQSYLQRAAATPVTGARPSAADYANSDLLAMASQDPRSAAGIAARNLRMDSMYGGTPRERGAAAGQLATLTTGAAQQALSAGQQDAEQARQDAIDQNSMALENLRGQYGLADTLATARAAALSRPGDQVTLADGTIGLLDPRTGRVMPTSLPNGAPARTSVGLDADSKGTQDTLTALAQAAMKLAENDLSAQKATPQEYRRRAAEYMGLPVQLTTPAGQQGASPVPTVRIGQANYPL